MTITNDIETTIIRTERGLTIAGTRITLYDFMDYIHAGYPPKLIRNYFYITDDQFKEAMTYIETHQQEVEAEYQLILKEAEEDRNYWNEKNKERLARIATLSPKPEHRKAWEKLKAWKERLKS
jgi:uncharacterized protein (DUF433 family)